MTIIIYTDGSSTGKQGKAGAAALLFIDDKSILVAEPLPYECGNNTAELYAILLAVRELPYRASAKIHTDSNNCIMWLAGDWSRKNEQVKAVADEIDTIWREKDLDLSFQWIKGHGTDTYNQYVDKIAKQVKDTKEKVRREIAW